MKPILYLDMDDVLVNFKSSKFIPNDDKHIYNHPCMYREGFFLNLAPMEGAINFVKKLLLLDKFEIHILTQPVAKSPSSYSEKVLWIEEYLPELLFNINMTQNKLLLKGDILIDDNLKWKEFHGKFIHFNPNSPRKEFIRIYKLLKDY